MRYAKIYQYQIPTVRNSFWQHEYKNGLIVELQEDHKIGRGEVAPLDGFSYESFEQAKTQLLHLLTKWCDQQPISYRNLYPSVGFGFSTAIFDLDDFFLNIAYPQDEYIRVKLCKTDQNNIDQIIDNPNLKIIKIKIDSNSLDVVAKVIQKICKDMPKIKIRLDANRGLSYTEVEKFAKLIYKNLPNIEFFEEPVSSKKELTQLANKKLFNLAIDESLQQAVKKGKYQSIIKNPNNSVIIIKPTLIGDLFLIKEIIEYSKINNKKIIISSSFESSFTLYRLLTMSNKWLPQSNAGLDTMFIYQKHLIEAFDTKNYSLPIIGINECKLCFEYAK